MSEFYEIWGSYTEARRLECWNSLIEFQKRGIWNLLKSHQKLDHWNSLNKTKKEELWKLLKDFQKEEFWNSLKCPERKEFWNSLEISYKAELLKILSIKYTLAQIVFATRKRVEDRLRKEECFKKYNIKNVYITLEELLEGEEGKSGDTAYIDPDIRSYGKNNKTLYLRIVYSTSGGIVEYDSKNHISRKCARFLVGHEIGHILLHLENIIKNIMDGEKLFKPEEEKREEKRADFFAQVISDLRDLYLLRENNDTVRGDEEVANSYNKKVEYADITTKDIVELAISINKESKKFTMSSYIFAAKKIMSTIYSEEKHKISEIFSRIENEKDNYRPKSDIVRIGCFRPKAEEDAINFGYSIEVPNNVNPDTNSRDTANGIGALLLSYNKIKNEKLNLIPIDKKKFPMDKIKEFSDYLLNVRIDYLKNLCQQMKSRNRLIKHKV